MDNMQVFKSIVDQDRNEVVVCDLDGTIIYMNPASVRHHAKRGGEALVGMSMMRFLGPECQDRVRRGIAWFRESADHNVVYTAYNEAHDRDEYMVALRDEDGALIAYYEKHECRTRETMSRYDLWEGPLA